MKHYIIYLMSALFLVACEAIPQTEFTDRPVVCCYLTSGEIPTLTVEKLIPFQGDATFSDEEVDKLAITITDMTTGTDYLMESVGEGLYRNDRLAVESGHKYSLSFIYDNVPVSAEAEVPSLPEDVAFSATSIEVMSFGPMPMPMPRHHRKESK